MVNNGIIYLVDGLEHGVYDFPYIGKFIIPTDELIFFRGVGWNHQPGINQEIMTILGAVNQDYHGDNFVKISWNLPLTPW